MTELFKRYIDVIVIHHKSGEVQPIYVCWENGRKYKIERIISSERRASVTGGCGIRYSCIIQGNRRNLFLEKDKWFIESTVRL